MGWCHEFGTQICEGCSAPMVATPDSCTCAQCGTVCEGRFKGCGDVWARSGEEPTAEHQAVAAAGATTSTVRFRGARPAGEGGVDDDLGALADELEGALDELEWDDDPTSDSLSWDDAVLDELDPGDTPMADLWGDTPATPARPAAIGRPEPAGPRPVRSTVRPTERRPAAAARGARPAERVAANDAVAEAEGGRTGEIRALTESGLSEIRNELASMTATLDGVRRHLARAARRDQVTRMGQREVAEAVQSLRSDVAALVHQVDDQHAGLRAVDTGLADLSERLSAQVQAVATRTAAATESAGMGEARVAAMVETLDGVRSELRRGVGDLKTGQAEERRDLRQLVRLIAAAREEQREELAQVADLIRQAATERAAVARDAAETLGRLGDLGEVVRAEALLRRQTDADLGAAQIDLSSTTENIGIGLDRLAGEHAQVLPAIRQLLAGIEGNAEQLGELSASQQRAAAAMDLLEEAQRVVDDRLVMLNTYLTERKIIDNELLELSRGLIAQKQVVERLSDIGDTLRRRQATDERIGDLADSLPGRLGRAIAGAVAARQDAYVHAVERVAAELRTTLLETQQVVDELNRQSPRRTP